MEYVRFAVKFAAFAFLAAVIAGYVFMVYNGDLPKPDFEAFAKQVAPSLSTGGSATAVIAVGLCCMLTAVAPFIYAARSGDLFTVIVSIVALVVCFVLLTFGRTVIDMVLAAIVYFTSALISVVMYSTSRIASAIEGPLAQAMPIQRTLADR